MFGMNVLYLHTFSLDYIILIIFNMASDSKQAASTMVKSEENSTAV
jgi:hypothetical protein